MKVLDYSGSMYSLLVDSIASNYKTYSISAYIHAQKSGRLAERFVIMRHDVDANPKNAMRMARTDADHGIRSTFYFRMKRGVFVQSIVRGIARMGHEIGYHYETLSDAGGDIRYAHRLFRRNLNRLRQLAIVQTACMHGRALSKHHNLLFWEHYTLDDFQLIGEPYLSIDYRDMYYFSDTGLKWHNKRFNLRDSVQSKGDLGVQTSPDLISIFQNRRVRRAAVLTHTNNWVDDPLQWAFYKMMFFFLNHHKAIRKAWTGSPIMQKELMGSARERNSEAGEDISS